MKPALKIGSVHVHPAIVLAPMEGVTDRPFRTTIRGLGGCGLAVTEFVSSESLTRNVENAWRMAEVDPSEHPVSIQIYGRDPQRMADAARSCEQAGADIVDLNLGCPSKKVTSGCAGSALMKEPERARDIFQAVAETLNVPMTVKMRLGWDHDDHNASEIAALAVGCGAKMIAVHGRTRTDGYKGRSRWEEIRRVVEAVPVPVLVNGDVICVESANRALEASGAAGVMVGRGVMGDPWLLARIAADWSGTAFVEPTLEDRVVSIFGYLDRLDGEVGANGTRALSRKSLAKLKHVVGYFTKGLYNAAKLRQVIHKAQDVSDARLLVRAYFAHIEADDRQQTYALESVLAS